MKPFEIQEKYFLLLETVVFQLNYVPCKELSSLSLLLKAEHCVSCSIICMKSLIKILRHNNVFKNVYREVGLLEVFVTCLTKYQERMKSASTKEGPAMDANEEKLSHLVIEALTLLLANNLENANVFRQSGGAKISISLVSQVECRPHALGVLQQLILSSGSDEDMGALLGLLHTAECTELQLKIDILKSLLVCLKESHRTRTVFRKVGGFVYVMSVLVSLEGTLSDLPPQQWTQQPQRLLLTLLMTVFNTLTTAMRYEPANAKFFHQEICYSSLCDTLRLLGCFSKELKVSPITNAPWSSLLADDANPPSAETTTADISTFHTIFTTSILEYV